MRKRFIATIVCSAVSLIGAGGCALAETIGRYQCSVIDIPGQEPIGDRPGHFLVSTQNDIELRGELRVLAFPWLRRARRLRRGACQSQGQAN